MSIITQRPRSLQAKFRIGESAFQFGLDDDVADLVARIRDSESQAGLAVGDFLEWSPELLERLIFIAGSTQGALDFWARKQSLGSDFLTAVASLPIDPTDLDEYQNFKQRIATVIALLYTHASGPACARAIDRINALGVSGESVADLKRLVVKIRRELDRREKATASRQGGPEVLVHEVLPDAPVDDTCTIPGKYRIEPDGVGPHGQDAFISCPVLIQTRLVDVRDDREKVKVCWFRDGRWASALTARRTIADARSIIQLSDLGLPVTSNHAADLVAFLADYEAQNLNKIPFSFVTSTLGYHKRNGGFVFVLPDRTISQEGVQGTVTFFSEDDGVKQVADGFHPAGSLDDWLDVISEIQPFPRVMFALYASLAPATLCFLRFPNILVDFCGRTSGGKTVALKVAASVWGNPDERSSLTILNPWSGTKAFFERAAAIGNNLPLIIDDSKNARSDELVSQTVYALTQGRVPGRATITGLQTSGHYEGIIFSSGERPITGFSRDGGTRVRTVSLWGTPFGEVSGPMGQVVNVVNGIVLDNYGLAGPAFVQFLLDNFDRWDEWREEFDEVAATLKSLADQAGNQFAARLAPSLAAITMAARIAHACFGIGCDTADPIAPIWDAISAESADADQARIALQQAYAYAVSNQDRFDQRNSDLDQPAGGFLGRWDKPVAMPPDRAANSRGSAEPSAPLANWPYLAFVQTVLEKFLADEGFDADAVIRAWWDAGWLRSNEAGRRTLKAGVGRGKEQLRMIAVTRQAVLEVCGC